MINRKEKHYLKITPTLLNAFAYIFNCKEEQVEQAKESFINYLKRVSQKENEFIKQGKEYEKSVYENKDEVFSPIIKGGCFQVKKAIKENIDGVDYMLVGVVDVLKGGVVYDIKKVVKYERPKYFKEYQHEFYLKLFPNALNMQYLICDISNNHFIEQYNRGEGEKIETAIRNFISYLKENNLYDVYVENWRY